MSRLHEPGEWLEAEVARLRAMIERQLSRCESPVEQTMMLALIRLDGVEWYIPAPSFRARLPFASLDMGEEIGWLYCQREALHYRLDFAIVTNRRSIAIEVDGHDFHERTKEQAAHDKSRDRALVAAGWQVLRFTGSEVWRDAHRCISEVQELLWQEPSTSQASAKLDASQTVLT